MLFNKWFFVKCWTFLVPVMCLIVMSSTTPAYAAGSAPTINLNCTALQNLYDTEGALIRFEPIGTITYTGKKIWYWIYYSNEKNIPLGEQSQIYGWQSRSTSSTYRGMDYVNWKVDFHNSSLESYYYSSKYLEFTIRIKDAKGLTSTRKCIYTTNTSFGIMSTGGNTASNGFSKVFCTFNGKKLFGDVYFTNYAFEADIKVYESQYSFDSDLKVYLTNYSFDANTCGKWHPTKYSFDADLKVYLTKYSFDADITVYETKYSFDAG